VSLFEKEGDKEAFRTIRQEEGETGEEEEGEGKKGGALLLLPRLLTPPPRLRLAFVIVTGFR